MQVINSGKVSIETKYFGPTNCQGARIKAIVSGESKRSIIVPWDYAKNTDENHTAAALALCKKFEWDGKLVMGGTKNGYVFVFIS